MERSSGAIIPNTVSNSVDQQRATDKEAAGENTDSNSVVPFLQVLNQQVTSLNPTTESVNENKNGLAKQNQMLAMAEELGQMDGKGTLTDFAGLGKVTLFKNEDSKAIADILADQLLKANNLKLVESQSLINNATKSSAVNIADKSGLVNMDALRSFSANMAGNFKNALKETNIVSDKNSQDISPNSLSVANNGIAKVSSLDDISTVRIINRIAGEIKENISSDGGRIKITLSPPSLGTLEMDVTVRNNKVEVIIIADNKDVQQTLNTHLDRLKGSLLNHGLTIDRCDVLMQNNKEGYQQNYSQQASYRDGSAKSNNTSKEKYSEEVKPLTSVKPQIINSPSRNSDNISIFA